MQELAYKRPRGNQRSRISAPTTSHFSLESGYRRLIPVIARYLQFTTGYLQDLEPSVRYEQRPLARTDRANLHCGYHDVKCGELELQIDLYPTFSVLCC